MMRKDWRIWWSLNWLTVLLVAAWLAVMLGGIAFGGGGTDVAPDPADFCEPVAAYSPDC